MTGHDDDIIVGKAYDAVLMRRLMGYLRPYWPQVLVAFAAIVCASVLQLAQPYLMKLAIDRYIATGDLAGMDRIALLFLGILLASFALEFVQTYVLQLIGPADHVRPAGADLRAPAAPGRGLLRPQPGRPPDDAGHDGRRRAERPVHVGRGVGLRRHLHAGRAS